MAWLDDRLWCHTKITDLSDRAFRVYINGITYSSGMGTKGVLTLPKQRLLGASRSARAQLIEFGLWDELEGGTVVIHDWDDYNGKRDERRKKDRERKRRERMSARASAGQSNGASAGPAHVEGSEGSEVTTKARTTTDVGGSS